MVNTSGFWHFKSFLPLKLTLYSFFKVFFEIKLHLQICAEHKLLWRFAKSRSWGTFKRYASKLFLSYYICIFKLETAKVLPWRLFEYCLLLLITRFTPFTTIIILKIYRKFLQKIECLCNLCLSKLNILILKYIESVDETNKVDCAIIDLFEKQSESMSPLIEVIDS